MRCSRNAPQRGSRAGLTILELVVVLAILAVIVAIAVPLFTDTADHSRIVATKSSMVELRNLIANRYMLDMRGQVANSASVGVQKGLPGPDEGHIAPSDRTLNPQLAFLFLNPTTNSSTTSFNAITSRGWRGPYLSGGGRYPGIRAESAETRGFTKNFGIAGDPTPLDGWGNPIVLISGGAISSYTTDGGVIGVLVSAGPDEDLTTISDNEWQPLSAS